MSQSYASEIRRKLHMYPETGTQLPMTLALLRQELETLGVSYTEDYGVSSIVATVNPEKSHFTIGIRADTDALPIQEQNDVPYCSRIDGHMHACGHDAHTAIALATLREIWNRREQINCRVKFLFQSSEEAAPSGAKRMVQDRVMEDIDCIVALHCDPSVEAGQIALSSGPQNATSDGFYLDFYGKSSHAAKQEEGIDAIMMAVRAYTDIEFMLAKEVAAKHPVIFNVGSIHGGEVNNVLCDHCTLHCSLRTQDDTVASYVQDKIQKIITAVASTAGGRATYTPNQHLPIVHNHERLTQQIDIAAQKVIGAENLRPHIRTSGGEDFSYFASEKPGCMFRLGVRNAEKGITYDLHQDRFDIDEAALEIGVNVFLQFILDNMNGIDFSE